VVLVGAVISMVRLARPAAEPADQTIGVFVLTELRPSLLLLALVVGADHGVAPVVVGAAIAMLAGFSLWRWGRRWNDTVLRWAAGLCTAALVVVAVALLVDGVFSV